MNTTSLRHTKHWTKRTSYSSSEIVQKNIGLLALYTGGFAIFLSAAISAGWYLIGFFQNDSYKAVVLFLILIMASNVFSKYMLWLMQLKRWTLKIKY